METPYSAKRRREEELKESRRRHERWIAKIVKRKKIWHALRQAQRKAGCTTTTLRTVAQSLAPFLEDEASSSDEPLSLDRVADAELLEAAEAYKLYLHGCVGCNDFVYGPRCHRHCCPKCGHSRYDGVGKPNEVWNYCC